jgi:hypothetical protein
LRPRLREQLGGVVFMDSDAFDQTTQAEQDAAIFAECLADNSN